MATRRPRLGNPGKVRMHQDTHSNEPLFLLPRFDGAAADARFLIAAPNDAQAPAPRDGQPAWRLRAAGPMKKMDEAMAQWGDEIELCQLPSSQLPSSGAPGGHWPCYRAMAGVVTRLDSPPPSFAHVTNPPRPEPPLKAAPRRFLVLVETDCSQPRHVDDFNRWYDEVHIPDVLASPYYRSAWRLEAEAPTPGRGRFLTFYEVHTDDIVEAMRIRDERRMAEFSIGAYAGAKGLVPLASSLFEPR